MPEDLRYHQETQFSPAVSSSSICLQRNLKLLSGVIAKHVLFAAAWDGCVVTEIQSNFLERISVTTQPSQNFLSPNLAFLREPMYLLGCLTSVPRRSEPEKLMRLHRTQSSMHIAIGATGFHLWRGERAHIRF